MLFIKAGDKQYGLVFQHAQFDEPIALAGQKANLLVRGTTTAQIFDAPPGIRVKEQNALLLGKGIALCSAKDVFSKEKGRRVSLADALKEAGFDAGTRKQVWDGYFATRPTKDPR